MTTIDKENLQVDASNTATEPEMSENEVTKAAEPENAQAEESAAAVTKESAAAAAASETPASQEEEKTQAPDAADAKRKADTTDAPVPIPPRPVKRARTAYFIFADDRRAAIQAKHPGEGVAVVARELGKIWGEITPEEKEGYQKTAAEERARVAQALEAWKAAGGVAELPSASKSDGGLILPVARIRKICKLDPDVKNLSKEALLLVTKAAELMTAKLAGETVRVAQIQNRRKLLPDDVAQVCATRENFMFLREDIQDLAREAKTAAAAATASSKTGKKADTQPAGKPLTAYFAVKPK